MSQKVASKPNRLAEQSSPYLLQHAENPVDWFPWGEEAFEKSKAEDKPIFLSIGYSTCHWCHVMERESFENPGIADLMNKYYVSIKVDREERPDLDELYMTVTQMLTGQGGWPNSIWLTPDRKPWYAGTYFPPKDIHNMTGFSTLLKRLAGIWDTRREEVEAQADGLTEAIKKNESVLDSLSSIELNKRIVERAIYQMESHFDDENGGFGTEPKFPPHSDLALLAYESRKTQNTRHREILSVTLMAMARGGIYDQAGGGFHRYSTDAQWFQPHFEKMLYDNAQLLKAYVDGYLITGEDFFGRIARETADWVLRDMVSDEGVFYSAMDADSEGEEGRFYLWTAEQLRSVLGEWAPLFIKVYGVSEHGNHFVEATGEPTGKNILWAEMMPEEVAEEEDMEVGEVERVLAECRKKLLEERNKRVWPHLDDKSLTGWNGLMIGSLAYAGAHLGDNRYIEAARKAADFILNNLRNSDGALYRSYRNGNVQIPGYLEDYVFLVDGLLQLYEITGEDNYYQDAVHLTNIVIEEFEDRESGGFFLTSRRHEDLLLRIKDAYDKAIPSGNGIAANILVDLWRLTVSRDEKKAEEYLAKVRSTLQSLAPLVGVSPMGTKSLVLAVARYLEISKTTGRTASSEEKSDRDIRVKPVTIDYSTNDRDGQDNLLDIEFTLSIDEGWHINDNDALSDLVIPTTIVLEDKSCIEEYGINYPKGEVLSMAFSDEPISVYQGKVNLPVWVKFKNDCLAESLRFIISFQPCNERTCGIPEKVEMTISVDK